MTEINFSPFFSGWNSSLKYESKNSRKTSYPRPRSLSHRMWTRSHYNFEPNGPVRIQSYYSHCRPKYKLHQLDYGKSDIPLVIDDIAPCYLYIFAIEDSPRIQKIFSCSQVRRIKLYFLTPIFAGYSVAPEWNVYWPVPT